MSGHPVTHRLEERYRFAAIYFGDRNFEEALTICNSIYEENAEFIDNLVLLAACHYANQSYSEALFFNQQALRLDDSVAEIHSNIGNCMKALGNLKVADESYMKAIQLQPDFADAYNNLACNYAQNGEMKKALETLELAVTLNPGLPNAHNNLGNMHKIEGNVELARKCYQQAIRIDPFFAEGWSNLGGILKDEGDLNSALAHQEEAYRCDPKSADTCNNYGNILKETGDLEKAAQVLSEAVTLRPDFAVAHGNLANVLFEMGHIEKALSSYKRALQFAPTLCDAHNNLGNVYRHLGRLDDSIISYKRALEINPNHPHAYNNLGTALKDKGLVKEALHCYKTACKVLPTFSTAFCNLGCLLKDQGKFNEAVSALQTAVDLDPRFTDAYCNLGSTFKAIHEIDNAIKCFTTAISVAPGLPDPYAHLAHAFLECNRIGDALVCAKKAVALDPDFELGVCALYEAKLKACDWSDRDQTEDQLVGFLDAYLEKMESCSFPGFCPVQPLLGMLAGFKPNNLRELADVYSQRAYEATQLMISTNFRHKARRAGDPLRIGFVASDFQDPHISMHFTPLPSALESLGAVVRCYSLTEITAENRPGPKSFASICDCSDMPSDKICSKIQRDNIHILVNLDGHSSCARNEIFLLKPALLTVSWLFPGTLGNGICDYMIGDKELTSEETVENLEECVIRLDCSAMFQDTSELAQGRAKAKRTAGRQIRSDYGLPNDKVVLAYFGFQEKLSKKCWKRWMKILKKEPSTILWIPEWTTASKTNLLAETRECEVEENRIIFAEVTSRGEHLMRLELADIVLDSFAFSAFGSCLDGLYCNKPVVTLAGNNVHKRRIASVLAHIGLEELITHKSKEYEEMVCSLVSDKHKRDTITSKLSMINDNGGIFDLDHFADQLMKGFHTIWAAHEKGLQPMPIDLNDE
eukprot:TRINITY_DN3476_c0_g1_i4.p1 TRINITY_DN3476_c0_g1~~TRINITY_DN3476_c0_g1_i4.p1  ORF type:complete len:926 (-),score=211.92 TRINITY_DN3476_c0_g1_i4:154-2931(-)